MKNILIIGETGAGKSYRLHEMIKALPKDTQICLYEPLVEIEQPALPHHFKLSMVQSNEVAAAIYTALIAKKPSLIIIEQLHSFENLELPYDLPVFATMQVATVAEAHEKLKANAINIQFDEIIQL